MSQTLGDPLSLITVVASAAVLVTFLVIGWRCRERAQSLTGFFLTPTAPSEHEIVATLATTNTALALTVFWHSFLGWQYGIGAAFWLIVFWIIGLEVFNFFARRITDFPGTDPSNELIHQTLHEYLSPDDWPRRALAVTSIATFLLMVTVELTRGAAVFKALDWSGHSTGVEMMALVVVGVTAYYAAVGGFAAVISTDVLQWKLAALAIFVALGLCVWDLWPADPALFGPQGVLPSTRWLPTMLLIPSGGAFIAGSLFSWGFWFVVTMDMWQRSAAARSVRIITARTRLVLYSWFALLSTTSVLMGLVVRIHDPGTFVAFPAVRFLEILREQAGAVPFVIVFVGFVSALISTVDTYFLVIAHSIFRDLPGALSRPAWATQPFRRWMVGLTVFALGLAIYPVFLLLVHSAFDINALVYVATSLPFVLLPFFLLSRRGPLRSSGIVAGVVVGWLAVGSFVFWAMSGLHASYAEPAKLAMWYDRTYFAPVVAALGASIGYFAGGAFDRRESR